MPSQDQPLAVHQYRIGKSKGRDAVRDRFDLAPRMGPGIPRVGFQCSSWPQFDREFPDVDGMIGGGHDGKSSESAYHLRFSQMEFDESSPFVFYADGSSSR